MRVFFIILLLVLATEKLQAQVFFKLIHPRVRQGEHLYLAGNVNNWQPKDKAWRFTKLNDSISLLLLPIMDDEKLAKMEFKFTLGSWDSVEVSEKGRDIANRVYTINKVISANGRDTVLFRISNWKHSVEKQHTIVGQLRTLEIKGVDRRVRLWIPKEGLAVNDSYKVLYCFDGQNLFDDAEAPFGEWHLDETLQKLNDEGKKIIAIAIDHGEEKRIAEYTPFEQSKYPSGDGDSVLKAIIEKVIPQAEPIVGIDISRGERALLGSSLGGLMSAYGLLKYQRVFGKAIIFSPAFWINKDSLNEFTVDIELNKVTKAYILAGAKESVTMVKDAQEWLDILKNKRKIKTKLKIVAKGTHSESFWSAELEQAIRYVFF